ncbi:MAG: hypothetical protein KKA54_19065 [Proteobacteria bacterium]|nr:hypothetical protein [Pseudomonadota bacterium]
MMNNIKKLHFFLVVALMSMFALPGLSLAAEGPLVSVDWLAKNLQKKDLVLLDVGAFTHYENSHIPGAVKAFGPWQTMNDKFVGFMMPEVEVLAQMLRDFGVNNDSFVVVYDEGVTVKDTAKSARALWTLHALGHDKVAILDGGFAAWDVSQNPVTTAVTISTPGNFKADFKVAKLATLAEVKSKIGSSKVVFVDTRIAEEHFGHEKVSHIKRFGHLPGARLWPDKYMTNAGVDFAPSYLKDVEELKQMAVGVGIPADKNVEIITYSNQGKSAAMGYFVLHDILGYKNVKIYDGSLLEYAPEKNLPMETNSWGFIKM